MLLIQVRIHFNLSDFAGFSLPLQMVQTDENLLQISSCYFSLSCPEVFQSSLTGH